MLRFLFLISIVSISAFAAGDAGHHGSAKDLIAPAINFIILAGFLAFKLKNPMSKHFTDKSNNVEETMKRASQRSAEAKAKFEEQQDKLKSLDTEKVNIHNRAKEELGNFKTRYTAEVDERIEKVKSDGKVRISTEKSSMVSALNKELIEKVVAQAREKIKADSGLQTKVTSNLLKELR